MKVRKEYSENRYVRDLLRKIKVRDVMSFPVHTIYDYEPLSKAMEIFVDKGVYYLPVVNKEDQIVGMLTSKYVYKTQSPRKILSQDMTYRSDMVLVGDSYYDKGVIDTYKLGNVMHPNPITLTPEDSAADAIVLMAKHRVGCIPIVKVRRQVCGILTTHDIVRVAAQILTED